MSTQHFDFIVIGGGSGGYAAARTAREVKDKVAIVDGADELGGLCILRGCMPSKTLIYSAEVLHLAQKGSVFGLDIPTATADMPALHERKLEVIKEFSDYRQEQLESERFTLFRNTAHFVDENTIELDDGTQLSADHFMIATGSVVATPPIPGLADAPCWTSDDILELDFKPEKVIVLGGGIVACELAQFLRRIGSEVIQIQRSEHILSDSPVATAKVIEQAFRDEGIALHTGTDLKEVRHDDSGFTAIFEQDGKIQEVQAPHLLNALGRKPNTAKLQLGAAKVDTDKGRILCNEVQQTSNPAIYASGDCCGPHEIVHIAIMQGEIGARHATGREAEPVNYDHLLGVIFTDPQIGTVGLSEEEAKRRGIEVLVADYPFDDHGKSILMEAKYGYVKVIADKLSGVVIGAECVAKDGGELIHALGVAVALGATAKDLLKVHWYHPTLSEIWSYPLEDIVDELG
ncbi:MAG: NAD(P)/FAD-dependent oxidoreductase [Akkermansiaceae bacterium]|nr:NAD(P)/FAD-dependent oxidoreductase [Akkermansiaceae bacterium]